MEFAKLNCGDFIEALASKEPVPGGGGASALVGAVGTALGNMVGSLTLGKKKYADVQGDILLLKEKADTLQKEFLVLLTKDAEVFEPLSKAYGMPAETGEQKLQKQAVLERELKNCAEIPLEIMKKCCNAIDLHAEFAQKGTAIVISDVGVGVSFCKSALEGASLNVFINTKMMKDRNYADKLNAEAEEMLAVFTKKANEIFADVRERLV